MKSNFRRIFFPLAAVILAAFVFLGICSQMFLYHYFISAGEDTLYSNAKAASELASAYASIGSMEQNLSFYMDLSFSSRFSNTQTLICDKDGTVVLCSEDLQLCTHCGKKIPTGVLADAFREGRVTSSAMVEGIYAEARLAVAVPILSYDGRLLGMVVSSMQMTHIHAMLRQAATVFIITTACVLVVVLVFLLIVTRRQNKPIRSFAAAARQLGHGQFDVRVSTEHMASKEFAELAVAFNNMAASLQTAEAQRQDFVANVSHELKTPMTTIAGYLDGMLDGTIPSQKHTHYMQIVSAEVRRLSRLVRSMLEISRMQSRGLAENSKMKFDIMEAVGKVLVSFEQKINEKSLEVHAALSDEPLYVLAHQDSITQVIYNLMDNAVKFCSAGGQLGVQVQVQAAKAVVSISNTGPTIPGNELPLIFERFHKTDKSRSVDRDGVGLGLYIVKTIICSHGEDVYVQSRDEKTTFSFTVALAGRSLPERGQQNDVG